MAKRNYISYLVLCSWVALSLTACASWFKPKPSIPDAPAPSQEVVDTWYLEQAYEARLDNTVSDLSRVAAGAIGIGILAFLFGHLLAIPKWASVSTIGLGLLVATTAPQLVEFFGSDKAQYLMLGTFGILALALVSAFCVWLWSKLSNVAWLAQGAPEADSSNKNVDRDKYSK